jgi:hypothetical protein
MTLSAYFAFAGEHQQLAWMSGSTPEILVDSAVSDGQVAAPVITPSPRKASHNHARTRVPAAPTAGRLPRQRRRIPEPA